MIYALLLDLCGHPSILSTGNFILGFSLVEEGKGTDCRGSELVLLLIIYVSLSVCVCACVIRVIAIARDLIKLYCQKGERLCLSVCMFAYWIVLAQEVVAERIKRSLWSFGGRGEGLVGLGRDSMEVWAFLCHEGAFLS